MRIAPVWKRFLALVIDLIIVVTVFCLLITVLNRVLQIPIDFSYYLERGVSVQMTDYVRENFIKLTILYSLAKLSIVAPYFIFTESSRWQATVGKKLLGIKVGDFEGKRISIGKASLRFFGKWISGQILLIGYLMAFFTKNKQALHDFLAETFVFENLEGKIK
jgi:uncharacterized RDD family membrane protein YckC